jgi:hypothetical protein
MAGVDKVNPRLYPFFLYIVNYVMNVCCQAIKHVSTAIVIQGIESPTIDWCLENKGPQR